MPNITSSTESILSRASLLAARSSAATAAALWSRTNASWWLPGSRVAPWARGWSTCIVESATLRRPNALLACRAAAAPVTHAAAHATADIQSREAVVWHPILAEAIDCTSGAGAVGVLLHTDSP